MAAAKSVAMCDMPATIAVRAFERLNQGKIKLLPIPKGDIVTDVEPKELVYPEGWYYAQGVFTNKATCTTGRHCEVPMYKSNGERWDATYCTLDDDVFVV